MSTLTTFHLFPDLPTELRLKIWNLIALIPRVISVSCKRERLTRPVRVITKSFSSPTPVPPLLHVCRESRSEGLLTYTPMFKISDCPNYIYISFAQDTIQCADNMLEYIGGEEMERVQRMVLVVQDVAYFAHFHMEALMLMKSLKELELLAHEEAMLVNPVRRYVDNMIRDFEQARERARDWDCPRVRILDMHNGNRELAVIEGGVMPPELDGGLM